MHSQHWTPAPVPVESSAGDLVVLACFRYIRAVSRKALLCAADQIDVRFGDLTEVDPFLSINLFNQIHKRGAHNAALQQL